MCLYKVFQLRFEVVVNLPMGSTVLKLSCVSFAFKWDNGYKTSNFLPERSESPHFEKSLFKLTFSLMNKIPKIFFETFRSTNIKSSAYCLYYPVMGGPVDISFLS